MKNSQYLILVLICFLLSCQNVKVNDESNVIAIEETKVVVDSLNENSKDSIIKSVSENQPLDSILAHTAVSFHNWYNKGIGNDSIVIDASIILYEEDSTMVLDTT